MNYFMRIVRVLIFFLFVFTQCAKAENYRITNPSELSSLKGLKPGDEVIIASGVYYSASMKIFGNGTDLLPITLRSESPGSVVFLGESYLQVSGSFIIVKDFLFRDISPLKGQSIIELKTNDSRIENCVISGLNTKQDTVIENKWISLYGQRNSVSECSLVDKKNIGCMLVVWLEKGVIPNHKISNNYFSRSSVLKTQNGEKMNGQECIRIGTSDYSMQRAECLVRGNTFYKCDSEIEVISNKSCFNTFRDNLFLETQGALTLRHGNNALVEDNYFIGNNREGTAGIRVIGDNHTIRNNYFENIKGKNYQAAICLIQGVKNSPLNRYFQVKDCKLEGNVIKNCFNGIVVSYGSAADQSLPVISTQIIDNTIYNETQDNYAVVWIDKPEVPQVDFRNNVIYGGKYDNISEDIIPKISLKPTLKDVKKNWEIIKNNSGAKWAHELKN
jgi:poly(beta-D-mannuronate) lyase